MADEWRVHVERLDGRLNTVQETVGTHIKEAERRWEENRNTHQDLYKRVERPSWVVTALLSALTSTTVGLIVFVVTH